MEKKKADFKAGKSLIVSGREVFEFRPELVDDDDAEADDTQYADEAEEEGETEVNMKRKKKNTDGQLIGVMLSAFCILSIDLNTHYTSV